MAKLSTYISYENAKEAIEYYEKFFKATNTFRMPVSAEMAAQMGIEGDVNDTTMHGGFHIYDNLVLCSDAMKYGEESITKRMFLILDFNSEDEVENEKLEDLYNSMINADGIKIEMELKEQFWGGKAAQVIDKYGILWMLHSQPYSKI